MPSTNPRLRPASAQVLTPELHQDERPMRLELSVAERWKVLDRQSSPLEERLNQAVLLPETVDREVEFRVQFLRI
jgi:hypothetical protein